VALVKALTQLLTQQAIWVGRSWVRAIWIFSIRIRIES